MKSIAGRLCRLCHVGKIKLASKPDKCLSNLFSHFKSRAALHIAELGFMELYDSGLYEVFNDDLSVLVNR